MRKKSVHVILVASVLIFSSIAGCLANEETDEEKSTIVVSTYHVEQLVSAIAGDSLNVEILAPSNTPVHDYEPSATDLVRLQGADMFFYHGLGLETWIDATLDSLGDDAPLSFATHAMPGDESALDYEGMLLTEICELLADGPFEANELESVDYHAGDLELHAEPVAHSLSYAEHDDHGDEDGHDDHDDHGDEDVHDDHDDHGDEDGHDDHDDHGDEDGHDDHDDHGDEDGHDDHDDHGDEDGHDDHGDHDDHSDHDDHHDEHAHAEPMETKTNVEGCPADTVVSIYELEKGEYVLEFETEDHDLSSFNMVALKMGGAHHHHHHGHGDGPFEWAGIFSVSDSTHTWTMEKVDGSYADPSMRVVIIPTETPNEATMNSLEGGVKALIEGNCPVVNDGGTMTPIAANGSCFELTVNQDSDISSFTMDTAGMTGFAAYTAHSPYEFEDTQHYLKDSQGTDVEHVAEEGGGGHGDHDDHGDDEEMTPEELLEMLDSDDDGMLTWDEFVVLMTEDDDHHEACHDADTHETHDEYTNQADCEAAGHIWMEAHEEDGCHDTTTHETHDEYTNQADCEAAGHMWMEGDDDHGDDHGDDHDDHGDDHGDDHDDHGDEHGDDHDDHGDDHDDHAGEDDVHIDDEMMEVVQSIWNESDADMDGYLSGNELVEFIHDMDILFEAEEGVGYATIHIEAEGEYGFAVPAGVDMYILMAGGHEGHDDHDDHGDDHGDDHSDEDGDDHSDEEEALEYDPHSWLDPVAYKTQAQIVLDEMKKAFPDLADTFQANADAFMASLDEIDASYEAAFGANGTCTNRSVAANHNAYSYIAYRYDLKFVTVHGIDPEGEPSAADIAEVVEKIEEDEINVLFVEEYTDVTAVNSIVKQTNGVSVQILYTMELPPKDSSDDYLSLMEKNLDSLKTGLGC